MLEATGLPVEIGSGGPTTFNRRTLGIPKTHALDAACMGRVASLSGWQCPTLDIKTSGRGSDRPTRIDHFGFSRGYLMRGKRVHGFRTGDRVVARVPKGKKAGAPVVRVALRASGNFNIQSATGVIQGVSHHHCSALQRADGYAYSFTPTPREEAGSAA